MRKIEQKMIAAINAMRHTRNSASWMQGNTAVVNQMTGIRECVTDVFLHGNHIAKIKGNGELVVSLAGWNTATTRSRLSALVRAFNRATSFPDGLGVSTKQGQARIPGITYGWRIFEMRYHDDEMKAMIEAGTMTHKIWSATYPEQRKRVASRDGLCLELIGLEGCRVEATYYGERVRFQVGKSMGWKPCHLRLHNCASTGGEAISPGTLTDVVVIRRART